MDFLPLNLRIFILTIRGGHIQLPVITAILKLPEFRLLPDSHLLNTFYIIIMRYIPQSKYTFEEICEQCYNAINRPSVIESALKYDEHLYNEIRECDEWCKELVAQ